MKPGDIVRLTRSILRHELHPPGTRIEITSVYALDDKRSLVNGRDGEQTLLLGIPDYALEPAE